MAMLKRSPISTSTYTMYITSCAPSWMKQKKVLLCNNYNSVGKKNGYKVKWLLTHMVSYSLSVHLPLSTHNTIGTSLIRVCSCQAVTSMSCFILTRLGSSLQV